jgi:hypothetical protein
MSKRVRTYLFIWLAVVLVPLLGGRLVHLALAALAAAVFTIVWWWVTDVGALTEAADWTAESRGSARGRGADPRASRLHRQVRDVLQRNTSVGSDVILARTLVEIIDDRVRVHHGIDRAADPERFAAAVGADLDAFVRAVDAERTTVRAGQLPGLISRIERL